MKENKTHLHGISTTLCGDRPSFASITCFAKKYSEVTCKKCIKTEEYKAYLEGKYAEKPKSWEKDCSSGYYQTGKIVPWLKRIVADFNPVEAKALADHWDQTLRGKVDVRLTVDQVLEFIKSIWALLAINKEMRARDGIFNMVDKQSKTIKKLQLDCDGKDLLIKRLNHILNGVTKIIEKELNHE